MSRYLITFDMDTICLKENYHSNNYTNAYGDIKNILLKHGFENIQGSVYLGQEGISEAHGTIAIQELTARFDWFYSCISNIKFYRKDTVRGLCVAMRAVLPNSIFQIPVQNIFNYLFNL